MKREAHLANLCQAPRMAEAFGLREDHLPDVYEDRDLVFDESPLFVRGSELLVDKRSIDQFLSLTNTILRVRNEAIADIPSCAPVQVGRFEEVRKIIPTPEGPQQVSFVELELIVEGGRVFDDDLLSQLQGFYQNEINYSTQNRPDGNGYSRGRFFDYSDINQSLGDAFSTIRETVKQELDANGKSERKGNFADDMHGHNEISRLIEERMQEVRTEGRKDPKTPTLIWVGNVSAALRNARDLGITGAARGSKKMPRLTT